MGFWCFCLFSLTCFSSSILAKFWGLRACLSCILVSRHSTDNKSTQTACQKFDGKWAAGWGVSTGSGVRRWGWPTLWGARSPTLWSAKSSLRRMWLMTSILKEYIWDIVSVFFFWISSGSGQQQKCWAKSKSKLFKLWQSMLFGVFIWSHVFLVFVILCFVFMWYLVYIFHSL